MEQTHERCGGGTLTTAVSWGTVMIAMEDKPSWRWWLEEQSRRQWRRWGSRLWRRPTVGEPAVEEIGGGGAGCGGDRLWWLMRESCCGIDT
ncbi:hypothetical protein E3N88_27283 [Mikania micrantha]|uniref:Uncharacterized protein n=1 Tax=Mikania micrantha TaxID=192012 RepID=A0A5N6MZ72_9ASTR|nr:hypothetical protein E3N88_27283 [Mikania micrantha]